MVELTEQQIEQAIAAFMNFAGYTAMGELLTMAERMRRAAPFLQQPSHPVSWDEPTKEECTAVAHLHNLDPGEVYSVIWYFVRRRNAALQPKPVDPRIAVVVDVLLGPHNHSERQPEHTAVRVLAALDAMGK